MDDVAREFVVGLRSCFADLEDPRVAGRCTHSLLDILAITLLAVSCGADDWTDSEEFACSRRDWLNTFLELPGGIPSHDTFGRVLGLLERQQFAACLFQWTQAIHEATGGKLLAIDGKQVRTPTDEGGRSCGRGRLNRDRSPNVPARPCCIGSPRSARSPTGSTWASESGLTLGQVACEEKSNEITAIPELLKLLNIKGCTVTIDAMGTQKEIAAQIRQQKGHDVLALKGNQSGLAKDMQRLFDEGMQHDFADRKHEVHQTSETGHGREEERTCHVIEIPPRSSAANPLERSADSGGDHLASHGGWPRLVGVATVRQQSSAACEDVGSRDPPSLEHRELSTLGAGRELWRRACRRARRTKTPAASKIEMVPPISPLSGVWC